MKTPTIPTNCTIPPIRPIHDGPMVVGLVLSLFLSGCAPESGDRTDEPMEVSNLAGAGAEFTGLSGEPRASAGSDFWSHWGDGRAEMDSYRATIPRYGEPREGELVLIYVTEPHDRRRWIKDDGAEPPHREEVLKLNLSLKFLTGIYPYSVMTSVFSPVDDWGLERFQPAKIGHSVQEWCGHYLHQVWPGSDAMRSLRLSYFASEGESLTRSEVPAGTLYEDGLLIQLRELDGPFAGGEDWEGWVVPSLWNVRRGVAPAEPVEAEIGRERIPRGSAEVEGSATPGLIRFTLRYGDYWREYDVESREPRRIMGWRTSLGDTVRLVETRRLPYWTENDPDGRRLRTELGLSPSSSGIPPRVGDSTRLSPGGGQGC